VNPGLRFLGHFGPRIGRIADEAKILLRDRLNEIAEHCASLPVLDRHSPENLLYDEQGLPRE
jgi:hypothetical protein